MSLKTLTCADCAAEIMVPEDSPRTKGTVRCPQCGINHHLAFNAFAILSADHVWVNGMSDAVSSVMAKEPEMLHSRLTVDAGLSPEDADFIVRAVK